MRKADGRKRGLKFFLVFLLLGTIVAGAFAINYIVNLNKRLSSGVTQELRDTLVAYDAGEPFYMLLLGVDKSQERWEGTEYGSDESAYRSDTIILSRIDPGQKLVTLVSIHRDTLVDIPGYGKDKINSTYSIGGPALVTKTVSQFAGVPISHYAEIDFEQLIAIVDTLGGVEVDVPVLVEDWEYAMGSIQPGVQTLNGEQALFLCRARHAYDDYGDGDVYRAANQRAVIAAIAKKVLAADLPTMTNVISEMAGSITTDLDAQTIISLASSMRGIDTTQNIYSGMNPTEGLFQNETWYEQSISSEWRAMMRRVDQGLPPYESAEDDPSSGIAASNTAGGAALPSMDGTDISSEPEPPAIELPEEPATPTGPISVSVLNGTMINGIAGRISAELDSRGYVSSAADASTKGHEQSYIVYNGEEYRATAQDLASVLGGGEVIANDGSYGTDTNIVVLIGSDLGNW